MPSYYTAEIESNEDFTPFDYAIRCTAAFLYETRESDDRSPEFLMGLLRQKAAGTPVPDRLVDSLERSRRSLATYEGLSDEKWLEIYNNDAVKYEARTAERNADRAAVCARYDAMAARLPVPENQLLAPFHDFMQRQIRESSKQIRFIEEPDPDLTVEVYRNEFLAAARQQVAHAEQRIAQFKENALEAQEWSRAMLTYLEALQAQSND